MTTIFTVSVGNALKMRGTTAEPTFQLVMNDIGNLIADFLVPAPTAPYEISIWVANL